MAPHCSALPCDARTRARGVGACAAAATLLRATEFCRSSRRVCFPRAQCSWLVLSPAGPFAAARRHYEPTATSLVGRRWLRENHASPHLFPAFPKGVEGDRSSKGSITSFTIVFRYFLTRSQESSEDWQVLSFFFIVTFLYDNCNCVFTIFELESDRSSKSSITSFTIAFCYFLMRSQESRSRSIGKLSFFFIVTFLYDNCNCVFTIFYR